MLLLQHHNLVPFSGRLPDVLTGFPFNVIFTITFLPKLVKLFISGKQKIYHCDAKSPEINKVVLIDYLYDCIPGN
jgi:hypothetical protein